MRLALIVLATCAVFAQSPPDVRNAQLQTQAFSGELSSQLHAASPTWFGYAIKTRRHDGTNTNCCWDNGYYGCGLEGRPNRNSTPAGEPRPLQLEGYDEEAILLRVTNNEIQKVRVVSLACPLDAGGLAFVWITGVPAQASLKLFQQLLADHATDHLGDSAVFALSQHEDPAALELLIETAKHSPSTHVRGQALFWLAQQAGVRAAATIQDAIVNDPNTEVKKRAVFALSQLPKDEGVPKLIEVARTQKNPEVRKQALFWLGQSGDPRALAFIEEILTH